ncbi:hypothetical protein HII36_09735 [Nonomuraea sp. NN258]|uniref:hypothetical protein n=1 Tax=Nonomuraea antri TaxID=2730852 RepID=UPI00156A4475|nr:hypothetical protein [Nonomuraea antri]NRQ32117.1 hypothetical protein [Nonomuraea antri]
MLTPYGRAMARHDATCARELHRRRRHLPAQTVAEEITRCCGHNRLKAHRLARGWTVESAVEAFHQMCVKDELPARGLTVRSWLEWEADHPPSPAYQDLLCRLFLTGPVQLGFAVSYEAPASPPRPGHVDDVVAEAARSSFAHAAAAQLSDVTPMTVDHIDAQIRRLAVEYVYEEPLPLFRRMVTLRDQVHDALAGRHHPEQATALLLSLGQLCGLLSNASLDLGNPPAAVTQARSAWTYASIIDHHGLRAWVRGLQAMIAYWAGAHEVAADLARDGQRYAPGPTALSRLASIEALTRAVLDDPRGTGLAIQRARDALAAGTPQDEMHDDIGGEFGFPAAKFSYLAAATYVHLGDHARAIEQARLAIDLYKSGSATSRAYGNEALAHVNLATGYLMAGEIDDAATAISGVLTMSTNRRIDGLTRRLSQIRLQLLAQPRFKGSRRAGELAERIEDFRSSLPVLEP